MSSSSIGSNANGNEEVQRAANASKGSLALVKSLRSSASGSEYGFAYENRNTLRYRFSYTTRSHRPIGNNRPRMSVAVIHRSSSSTSRDTACLPPSPGASDRDDPIPRNAPSSFEY